MFINRYIYIIMEYCDGGDLSRFIHKRHKLPESVCKKFMQQLAMALKFLRSNNICHLDLKPQNLLLVTGPQLTLKIGGKRTSVNHRKLEGILLVPIYVDIPFVLIL